MDQTQPRGTWQTVSDPGFQITACLERKHVITYSQQNAGLKQLSGQFLSSLPSTHISWLFQMILLTQHSCFNISLHLVYLNTDQPWSSMVCGSYRVAFDKEYKTELLKKQTNPVVSTRHIFSYYLQINPGNEVWVPLDCMLMINSLWNWRKSIKHACSCHRWLLIWQDTVTLSRTNMFLPSWPSRTDMAVTLTTGYWLESLTPSDPPLGGGKQAQTVENLAHMNSMLRTATNFKPFSSLSRLSFRDCLVLIFISGTEALNKCCLY